MIFTFDKLIVSIISLGAIAFTYRFFLVKEEKEIEANKSIDILVEGGYSPEKIVIKKNKVTKLNFTRKDPTACLEEIVFPDFHIKRELPLNKKVVIELKPQTAGEFVYHCGMNMYHGKIVVR